MRHPGDGHATGDGPAIVDLRGVCVVRSGLRLLDGVDWRIRQGERWVVLGPNGSGKTTLVSVAATYLWPSAGEVSVLGRSVGSVDVRELRRHIGIVSAALETRIPAEITALDVVLAGATGALAPWWARHGRAMRSRAAEMLERVEASALAGRRFELLSSGEKQRVQIARALMPQPALLLLDEPAAGLDMGARERLAMLLSRLNAHAGLDAMAVVTHHVEEIAPGTTHALVLRAGRTIASGEAATTITAPVLSEAYGLPLAVHHTAGRYTAHAVQG